jgi:hypothetical protein
MKVQTPLARQVSDARPSRLRSRVTNGRTLFVEGDGRGPWARRLRDLCEAHAADLGGAECLSEAQRSLIRRCATIEVQLEQMEGQLCDGKACDLSNMQQPRGIYDGSLRRSGLSASHEMSRQRLSNTWLRRNDKPMSLIQRTPNEPPEPSWLAAYHK